jgi:hypothetical protein
VSLASLLVHTVTILRAGTTTDRYGNTEPDWDAATSETAKAWLSQQSRTEDVDGRDALIQVWVAFLPPDVSVSGHDRLVWSGITFDVDGPLLPAWTPRGLHHYEATLRVVEG